VTIQALPNRKSLLANGLSLPRGFLPPKHTPQVTQRLGKFAIIGAGRCAADGNRSPLHFFCFLEVPDFKVKPADETSHFGFNFWLITHVTAYPLRGLVQDFPQHHCVPTPSSRGPNSLQHFLKKPGGLCAPGRFSFRFFLVPACLYVRLL